MGHPLLELDANALTADIDDAIARGATDDRIVNGLQRLADLTAGDEW